jgi:hypothetical protein
VDVVVVSGPARVLAERDYAEVRDLVMAGRIFPIHRGPDIGMGDEPPRERVRRPGHECVAGDPDLDAGVLWLVLHALVQVVPRLNSLVVWLQPPPGFSLPLARFTAWLESVLRRSVFVEFRPRLRLAAPGTGLLGHAENCTTEYGPLQGTGR